MNTQTQEALNMAIEMLKESVNQIVTYETDCGGNKCREKYCSACNYDSNEGVEENIKLVERVFQTINDCKEALAQPAQEPVGFISTVPVVTPQSIRSDKNDVFNIPVFTHPAPSWQGLSDAVVMKIVWDLEHITDKDLFVVEYYRAIEQALKEKNDKS
jgi:hypothetical protein